jgi:hypothetical protein
MPLVAEPLILNVSYARNRVDTQIFRRSYSAGRVGASVAACFPK